MSRVPLVLCAYLDPREAADAVAAPIADAVNIPLAELPDRTHELPPRTDVIPVVGPPPVACAAVQWLADNGRHAFVQGDYEHTQPPPASSLRRLWRPNAFVARVIASLPPAHALDLACGSGRDAVYLASCGWHVTGVDLLPDALERAAALTRRLAPALESLQWIELDLERDTVTLPARYDLITGVRYLHRPLFARLSEWLAPGGSVIWETFTTLHRKRHGRPVGAAHVLTPDELPTLIPPELEIVYHSEGWHDDAHTARLWARRRA